jgi:hypothetical protein
MNQISSRRTAGFTNSEQDKKREKSESSENTVGVQNHIIAAEHYASASKYHYEAARYHEGGEHGRAAESTLKAHGYAQLAHECQCRDTVEHAHEA